MTDGDFNPYASPRANGEENATGARSTRWRIAPAAASFLVGALGILMGLLLAVGITAEILANRFDKIPQGTIPGFLLFLGFGATFILAGWFYWSRRYRLGLIATANGVSIFVVISLVSS